MRLLREVEWTIRTCAFVLTKAAQGLTLQGFLSPLLTLTAYPLLLAAGLEVPLAFVIAHSFGYALQIWLALNWAVDRLKALAMPGWSVLALHLGLVAVVLWLESPAAALRLLYLFCVFRILMLLLDLSDGKAATVQKFWPHPGWRPHDAPMTRALLLRDIAVILLGETVIFTGSVPLMLALVALWRVMHIFIDRVVAQSVLLAGQLPSDR